MIFGRFILNESSNFPSDPNDSAAAQQSTMEPALTGRSGRSRASQPKKLIIVTWATALEFLASAANARFPRNPKVSFPLSVGFLAVSANGRFQSLFLTAAAVPNMFPGQYRLQTHCCRSPLAAHWRFNFRVMATCQQ